MKGLKNNLNPLSYGLDDMSAMLGVSKSFLRLEAKRGNLKRIKLGRRVVVKTEEVHRYLNAGEGS